MSSKKMVYVGMLEDWLSHIRGLDLCLQIQDRIPTDEEVLEFVNKSRSTHLAAYEILLNELHTDVVSVKSDILQYVLKDPHEKIFCIWEKDSLVATAQASLMFPAMAPTVHISNVVVAVTHRGQGHGEFIMVYLRKRCRETWGRQYNTLKYELTSRAERKAADFYTKLGYAPQPTIRYTR